MNWVDTHQTLDHLLNQEDRLTVHPMEQGLEAEVVKICSDQESFVMKTWNKSSKPDVRAQFHLLNALSERGISVSRPVGWGIDPNSDTVLLTTFDGTPIRNVDEDKIKAVAEILSSIHRIRIEEIGPVPIPKYDFIGYFFAEASEHADIHEALTALIPIAQIQQDRIIHGDFHGSNIVEDHDRRYTVIDWTNGQVGDPRYDLAWALILQKIYASERVADVFCSAYLAESDMQQQELEVFEVLACLRWVLLYRSGGVPLEPATKDIVQSLLMNNSFLKALSIKIVA
ncbi:aminoglycoside phosphotransferase family protein [Paenibacillus filicis]|uniref:Aminoglycoside phosphotransferase family protein n=1 Tax=Paenibacillus filicis TaxID=669464 RepID=A0ABU9DC98_9BACL